MNKFTEGKWRVEMRFGHSNGERPVITSDNEYVDRIAIVSYHGVRTIKEANANAELIASAPTLKQQRDDLLRACELTCVVCFRGKPESCKTCKVGIAIANCE